MNSLVLHPQSVSHAITAIAATIEPTPRGCHAVFVVRGDILTIAVPNKATAGRFDDLWKTTCFEIFWSHDGKAYREFNLSPSGRWACYDFDDFREGMRDAPAAVTIACTVSANELRLEAKVAATLPLPATVALNAIIENADGVNQFWALEFQPGAPEFHSETCRALRLNAPA